MLTNHIATFTKVSLEQYKKDRIATLPTTIYGYSVTEIEKEYEQIKIPSRATSGSVGYDFYLPFDVNLNPGEFIVIPTGIRCQMVEGYSLDLYPKSGLGFKNFTTIANTIGIIDADYFYSDNEGHIMVKLINKGFDIDIDKVLERKQGESFVQGIFHECFGATNDNDNTTMKVRNGGFDSTR
jgi:dUTP pyrophosphatase